MFAKKQCPQIVCIVWTLLFFSLSLKAINIDSLHTELSLAQKGSEEELSQLTELSLAYKGDKIFDSVLVYGHQAFDLAQKLNRPSQSLKNLTALSYAYFNQRQLDSVLIYGKLGYDLAKDLNDTEEMYQTANDLMVANMEKNRLEENTKFIQDFERLYKQAKINPDKYSRILYLESFTCYMLEDVDALQNSVEKLKEVQPKVSEKKSTKTLGYTYYFGAQFFKLEEDFEAADSLFRKKLELNQSSQDTNGMAATYFDLALLHTESTTDYDKALEYLRTGLEITEAAGEKYISERLLGLQFYARVKNGYNELAAMQLDTMNALAEKAGSKSPSIFSARIYLSMGEFFYNEGSYDQAEEFYNKSEQQLFGQVNDPMIQLVYKAHSDNYLAMGESRMAYNYLQKALVLKDSIHQAELKNIIDYNRTQISLKDQANENLRLSNVIRKRNWGIAFAIFCGLVLLYIVWEKVETNRKLKKLNDKIASDAEKLAHANEHLEFFSRSIYHDINSRINLILSFSELKKKNAFPEPNENEVDEFTMLIYKNALFLKQFVQDIRTFSKLEQNNTPMKEIDLNSVVGLVLETFGGQIYEKKAVLNIPDLPVITGHETPVVQLFQNLTENAIKYTRQDAEPLINIGFEEKEDKYKFSIENNGSPIPQDVADRIFEPFYRIKKKNVNGSGLGLAICKRIVDYYGGRLWLEKSDETSTVFAFTLPKEFKKNIA